MSLSRRDMLKLSMAAAAHPMLPARGIVSQVFTAPGAGNAKFLLVFLRGGYDSANVVIPVGSDFYYEARPTIALPRPDTANPLAAIALAAPGETASWGLHPALKDSMLPLWQKAQLAFVPFAGSEDLPEAISRPRTASRWGCRSPAPDRVGRARASSTAWPSRSMAALRRWRSPTDCPSS